MPQEQKTPPSPLDALAFIDKIIAKVAGSRGDHVAIQGALGIIDAALQPVIEVEDVTDEPRKDSEKRVGHELQGCKAE